MTVRTWNGRCFLASSVLYTAGLDGPMTKRMTQAAPTGTPPARVRLPSERPRPPRRRPPPGWSAVLHRLSLALLAVFVCVGITSPGQAGPLSEVPRDRAALDGRAMEIFRSVAEPAHQVRESHSRAAIDLDAVEFDLDDDSVTDRPNRSAAALAEQIFSGASDGLPFSGSQIERRSESRYVRLPRGPPEAR